MAASGICISGLLVTVLILATVNFAVMNQRHFLFPTSAVLYNIEPVRENFRVAGDKAIPSKDVLYFSEWHKSKLDFGCYDIEDKWFSSDGSDGHIAKNSWDELMNTKFEYAENSVCNCIDRTKELYYLVNGTKNPHKGAAPEDFKKHVLEFCTINGQSQYNTKFEGVVNTAIMQWVGQVFLVGGILYELMASKSERNMSFLWLSTARSQTQSIYDRVVFASSALSVLVGSILYFVYSMHYTSQTKVDEVGYRHTETMTKFDQGGPVSVLIFIFFGVLLVVQCLALFVRYMGTYNPIVSVMTQFFNVDVLMNFGWLLLILSLAIQAKMQSVMVLSTVTFLVVGVGVVMYVSQALRLIYNTTCDNMSDTNIVDLQTKDEDKLTVVAKRMRRFLRLIGYVRLTAFFVTAFLAVLLLLIADITKDDDYLQNTAEGRYFWVVAAFLVSSVALDVVRECIPLEFEGDSDATQVSYFKYYFVVAYLLWLNFSVCLWWRHIIVHSYHDTHSTSS